MPQDGRLSRLWPERVAKLQLLLTAPLQPWPSTPGRTPWPHTMQLQPSTPAPRGIITSA